MKIKDPEKRRVTDGEAEARLLVLCVNFSLLKMERDSKV